MASNDRTTRRSSSTAPRKNTTTRSASGQRAATGQRAASGQRAAAGQRTTSGQRAATGQRPSAAARAGQSAQRRPTQAGAVARKRKHRVNPLLIVLIIILLIAIAVMAGIGVYVMRYADYDKIMPNVYVAGIDVGGMTRAEATAAIEAAFSDTQEHKVSVILPDQVLTFTMDQDTVILDVDSAVEQAYAYGRNSTSPVAIARAVQAAQRTRNDIDLTTSMQLDTDYINNVISTAAESVNTPMQDSTVETNRENHSITVTVGAPGCSLDSTALYDLVYDAFANGDYSDIEFDYEMTYPAAVQLDDLYLEMTLAAEDASYDPETGDISQETVGYAPVIPLDQANQLLATAGPGDVLEFTFEESLPTVTSAELEELLFRDTLASYGSVYAVNWGRTENLRLACAEINGTVLKPGEVFSFNKVVGERTAEKGYKDAIVYISGESEPEIGGGVCQVASTIYYCAMYADLEIVERSPHMFTVTYVPGGLDSTVYWGSLDFQFKNSTDYPLRIDAYLSNGRCYIALVGTNITGQHAEISSVQIASSPMIVYQITRKIYDANGNLIRTDTTADLDALTPKLGTSSYDLHTNKKTSATPTVTTTPDDDEPSASPSQNPTTPPTQNPNGGGSDTPDSGDLYPGGDPTGGGGSTGGGDTSGGGSTGGGGDTSGGGSTGGGGDTSGGGSTGGGDAGGGDAG